MKFEVDLIRYVIDIAIVRGTFFRSKDLNADWLPFQNIIEVYEDICVKLGISKDIEDRCYKALLKMSSSDERHVTWLYKVQNISKYLPSSSATHATKHTTNSWTRHKTKYDGVSTTLSPSGKSGHSSSPRNNSNRLSGFGINLGRLSERPLMNSDFDNLSRFHPPTGSPVVTQHAEFTSPSVHDEGISNSKLNVLAPPSTPISPQQFNNALFSSPPPPPPTGHYYQNYVPSPRLSTIAQSAAAGPRTPTAPKPPSPHAEITQQQNQSNHSAIPEQSPLLDNARFGEDAILAMHNRVVSIELEAKKTRQLLAHIAYLKSHSRASVLDSDLSGSPMGLNGPAEGHTRHVDYGELSLSPYLKQVLDLPPAVITTDVFDGAAGSSPRANGTAKSNTGTTSTDSRPHSPSPKSVHESPKAMHFSMDRRGRKTGTAPTPPPSTQRLRSPQPSPIYQRTPSPSSQQKTPHQQDQPVGYTGSFRAQLSPEAEHAAFTSSLRNSPAMQKYGSWGRATYSNQDGSSPSAQQVKAYNRDSAEFQAYLSTLAARSARETLSPRSSQNLHNALNNSHKHLRVNTSTPSLASTPYSSAYTMEQSTTNTPTFGIDYGTNFATPGTPGTPGAPTTPSTVNLNGGPAAAPSPASRYHNTCKTQHSEQAGVTVIDSKLDELLGDSLNIEEKDGRVYVHFQSKFVLPGVGL